MGRTSAAQPAGCDRPEPQMNHEGSSAIHRLDRPGDHSAGAHVLEQVRIPVGERRNLRWQIGWEALLLGLDLWERARWRRKCCTVTTYSRPLAESEGWKEAAAQAEVC